MSASVLPLIPSKDMYRIVPKTGRSAVMQAQTPENAGVGIRIAAVERITVMNLDHGIESGLVSGRPFDNFLALYPTVPVDSQSAGAISSSSVRS